MGSKTVVKQGSTRIISKDVVFVFTDADAVLPVIEAYMFKIYF